MQKDTPMGKAFTKALPAYGSSGPGDEPVRVGVGPAALTDEQKYDDFLLNLVDLSPNEQIGALTTIGLGVPIATAISKGLTGVKGRAFPTPKRMIEVSLGQQQYKSMLKKFGEYSSKMIYVPEELRLSNFKNSKDRYEARTEAFRKYASKEILQAYSEYRNIPTEDNRISFNKVIDKYGGPEHITIDSKLGTKADSFSVGINTNNPNYKQWVNNTGASDAASDVADMASRAVDRIKKITNASQADAEAIANRTTVGGAMKSGIGAVGNAYNNALSFLRGGGGPKTMGR
jgi:hypothetical protein